MEGLSRVNLCLAPSLRFCSRFALKGRKWPEVVLISWTHDWLAGDSA